MRTPETTANKERMRFLNKTLDRSTDQIAQLTKANAELRKLIRAIELNVDNAKTSKADRSETLSWLMGAIKVKCRAALKVPS